jgi:hypothetical protein
MRANDTRRKSNRSNDCEMPATKTVCFNPLTRRYEEVWPESETLDAEIITMYWNASAGMYMTIPGSE